MNKAKIIYNCFRLSFWILPLCGALFAVYSMWYFWFGNYNRAGVLDSIGFMFSIVLVACILV